MAAQGDILLVKLPASYSLSVHAYRIDAKHGDRIVLAEGEATGHNHTVARAMNPPQFRDTHEHGGAPIMSSTAALYEDLQLLAYGSGRNIVQNWSNAIGFLKVEGAATLLEHQEHAPITLEPGLYYVARQRSLLPGETEKEEGRYVAD
jgi:hypothetical protein